MLPDCYHSRNELILSDAMLTLFRISKRSSSGGSSTVGEQIYVACCTLYSKINHDWILLVTGQSAHAFQLAMEIQTHECKMLVLSLMLFKMTFNR